MLLARPIAPWSVIPSLLIVVTATGCGGGRPSRLAAPSLNPSGMAAKLIALGDENADGSLTGAELDRVPALKSILAQLDANGDRGLSTAELQGWLEGVRDSRVAITSFTAVVRHKGKPLAEATLKIEPLPPLATTIKAAEGLTDANGRASPSISNTTFPGVNCGLYAVRIEGNGNDGKPLPSKYNTETTLGVAVGSGLPPDGAISFDLE